jgi:WD40 repeat protein
VRCVDISNDGKLAVSGGDDRKLIVRDIEQMTKKYELAGHSDPVTSVVFSSDGSKILSGCEDGMVRVWDLGLSR